jgi:Pyruvate/2-oxoacid:ferredoxin oxidoreductase delta subunit
MRARPDAGESEKTGPGEEKKGKRLSPPEILTIEEVACQPIEGIDAKKTLSAMADIGPQARLFVYLAEGQPIRHEIFEDPRVCLDIHRGAVIENRKEKPKDVSGWRTHDFSIDVKGCLGDECGRCAIVCPENAIHLMGKGKGSFHEIDPLACKGCFICWVECVRTAADCILVDGKTFDPGMRAKHFGE